MILRRLPDFWDMLFLSQLVVLEGGKTRSRIHRQQSVVGFFAQRNQKLDVLHQLQQTKLSPIF